MNRKAGAEEKKKSGEEVQTTHETKAANEGEKDREKEGKHDAPASQEQDQNLEGKKRRRVRIPLPRRDLTVLRSVETAQDDYDDDLRALWPSCNYRSIASSQVVYFKIVKKEVQAESVETIDS